MRLLGAVSLLTGLLHLLQPVRTFYIPGVAPVEYKKSEEVPVKAVKMTSSHTQLPYEYYNLPFCRPEKLKYKSQNLGEILRGDRISNTPYKVQMKENFDCKVLCNKMLTWSAKEGAKVAKRVKNEYFVHFLVDGLPVATKFKSLDENENLYEHGFRLGYDKDDKAFINNHLTFNLKYHHDPDSDTYRVVGFEAEARSIDTSKIDLTSMKTDGTCKLDPKADAGQVVSETGETKLAFTYEVKWIASDVEWASRWDTYLAMKDVNIHWFSIINSLVVVLFLSGILTMIIIRTLRRDITQYNQDDDLEDQLEETGWKLVHGDVFRAPKNNRLFAAVIGSGVQLLCMSFIIITFAMLGMLSPASRGTLMTAAICFYLFMGLVAGYFSARLYKTMKGVQWKKAALLTATLFPTVILGVGFVLNFFIWGKHSSQAVPFTTMLVLLTLWFGISVPLVFLGYYFGFRKQPYQHPVRTNQIPRQVPDQQWYANPVVSLLMAGVLPFGAMFIELFFIFSALWENQFYYLFGFLFLVFLILIISCSQISIVMVYFQLCAENYHWWWRSFLTSGGCAVYVFFYSIFYFVTTLEIDEFIPTLMYFTYTLLMVVAFWLLTGTIGFYAAYFFVRRIYAAIKID